MTWVQEAQRLVTTGDGDLSALDTILKGLPLDPPYPVSDVLPCFTRPDIITFLLKHIDTLPQARIESIKEHLLHTTLDDPRFGAFSFAADTVERRSFEILLQSF